MEDVSIWGEKIQVLDLKYFLILYPAHLSSFSGTLRGNSCQSDKNENNSYESRHISCLSI